MSYDVILNNVDITSETTVPLNLTKKVERNIIVLDGTNNVLADSKDNDGKAVINSKGATNISGRGSLTVNATKKHGISSDNDINISDVKLTVNNTAKALEKMPTTQIQRHCRQKTIFTFMAVVSQSTLRTTVAKVLKVRTAFISKAELSSSTLTTTLSTENITFNLTAA